MNALQNFLDTPIADALARTLGHSIWEGAAIAVLLAIMLRLIPVPRSTIRYIASCAGLALVVVAFVITFTSLYTPRLRFRNPLRPTYNLSLSKRLPHFTHHQPRSKSLPWSFPSGSPESSPSPSGMSPVGSTSASSAATAHQATIISHC